MANGYLLAIESLEPQLRYLTLKPQMLLLMVCNGSWALRRLLLVVYACLVLLRVRLLKTVSVMEMVMMQLESLVIVT